MSERTITVNSYFGGDKEVTRDEFIKQWMDHVTELNKLAYDSDENQEAYIELKVLAHKMAANSFEETYKRQNN